LNILFVWPAAEFSIWDVARGLRRSLGTQGHNVRDYYLNRKLLIAQDGIRQYLPDGIPDGHRDAIASELASEGVVAHALWHHADLVVIVSGLNLHPACLVALRRANVPVAVWLTESPYEDEAQATWCSAGPDALVFTHDQYSATSRGWTYLPHAFDPTVHAPADPLPDEACDVLLIGTGWGERQKLLEAVDWTGIKLRIKGVWPEITEGTPLWPYFEDVQVRNDQIAPFYSSAKICLNIHRAQPAAMSLNPRAYEIAACGAFQLMDPRPETFEVFGDSVPTFTSAPEMEALIRHYLRDTQARIAKATEARRRVAAHTFDARATAMIAAVEARLQAA
jgi:spore maturation protein CgeB